MSFKAFFQKTGVLTWGGVDPKCFKDFSAVWRGADPKFFGSFTAAWRGVNP